MEVASTEAYNVKRNGKKSCKYNEAVFAIKRDEDNADTVSVQSCQWLLKLFIDIVILNNRQPNFEDFEIFEKVINQYLHPINIFSSFLVDYMSAIE